MSYATILIPSSGIIDSYTSIPGGAEQLGNALGIYLITWFMFTFLMLYVVYFFSGYIFCYITDRLFSIGALRKNVSFIALFAFLAATFAVLAIGLFTSKEIITKAGGALGIVTAFIAYYCALSELLVKEESFFTLPLGKIPKGEL